MHWTATLILCAFLLLSSYTYFFSESTIDGVRDLGFPDFFRIQLGVLKILAVVILLLPKAPIYLKEWAYAGFFFDFVLAFVAHLQAQDGEYLPALVAIVLLLVSYTLEGQLTQEA